VSLLELTQVSKRFGGLAAVDSVDLKADQGEILSVIGPNGAGKTTLFNIVTGFYSLDTGSITFDGHNIAGLRPNAVTRLGIARTFQAVRLFPAMTVLENVMVGQHPRSKSGILGAILRLPRTVKEEHTIVQKARETLAFFGDRLGERRHDDLAGSLAYADRRRLEIARAMATEPKLVLLDEPTAGMNKNEKNEIITLIGRLRDEGGYSIILIEHDMPVVKGVSDRVIALDFGRKIAEGTYDEVASNERVIEAYLGREAEAAG
jgi:ABC-type branched-subunit amino acid transport system ATPase component